MARVWQWYCGILLVAVAGYVVAPSGPVADVTYLLVGSSCVVAILLGVAVHRPVCRTAWYLMAAGQAASVAGDLTYFVEQRSPRGLEFPATSDVLYLMAYPLLALGVIALIRARRRTRDPAGLVDSMIVTAGLGLLSWALIAGPIMGDADLSALGRAVAVAYPAGDIIVLALLVRLMTGEGQRPPSYRFLVAATVTLVAADTGFATAPTTTGQTPDLDLLWLLSYVLWGSAALRPDMVALTVPGPHGPTPFTARRMAVLAGVILLPGVLLVARETPALDITLSALTIGAVVLSLLVMARMACDIEQIRLTSRQRDDLQEDLFRRVTTDEVTGLPNRPSFVEMLGSALERSSCDGTSTAVVVLDVTDVDAVVRHGDFHVDAVTRQLTHRLAAVLEPHCRLARIAPRQMAVVIETLESDADVSRLAHDLLDATRAPFSVGDQSATLSACAGVAVSAHDTADAAALLRDARLASASARDDGSVEFFDAALREEIARRDAIESDLATALRTDTLSIVYQPIATVQTTVVESFEALVRWDRPGHEPVRPDSFIPVAEMSDLVCDLDRWVLRRATRDLVEWTQVAPTARAGVGVAVNVSGRSLASPSVLDDVVAALHDSGLEPGRLTLEITETVIVDVPLAVARMTALRQLGVHLSIDDFGTGYTSIGQLVHLPVDSIKVDRSLVASAHAGTRELLALIVHVARSRDLSVLAEGVECPEQLAMVTELGMDHVQGYLVGMPAHSHDDALAAARSVRWPVGP